MSLEQRTISGVFWTGVSKFWVKGIQLLTVALLARLIGPEDFGLVGMAVVFINLAQILTGLGMREALIQRGDLEEDHKTTAFWVTIIMGGLIFFVLWAASGPIASFYGRAEIAPLIVLTALTFVIAPWGMIHRALLKRDLSMRQLTYVEATASVLSAVVAITMALAGFGVWSLVTRNLLFTFFTAIGLWIVVPWRPALRLSKSHFLDLFGFSRNVVVAAFIGYAIANMDYLVIGKFVGAQELGWYTMAFTLAMLSRLYLSQIVNQVAFPAFSRAGRRSLGRAYLRTVSHTALFTLPLVAIICLLAPEIVNVVLGTDWQPVVVPLLLLSVVGAIGTVATLSAPVFLSSGRSDIQMRWQLFSLASLVPALLLGVRWGIVGVAAALAIRRLATWPIQQTIVGRIARVSWPDYIRALRPAVLVTGIVAGALLALRYLNGWLHLDDLTFLIIGGIVAVLVGLISVRYLAASNLEELYGLLPPNVVRRLRFLFGSQQQQVSVKMEDRGEEYSQ